MADKSNAIMANSKYQLKIFYTGDSPSERTTTVQVDKLDGDHRPWLIKFYVDDGMCHQYIDSMGAYHKMTTIIGQILDVVIVNNKQRIALDKIVDNMLSDYFDRDMSDEHDVILDPSECPELFVEGEAHGE